MLDRFNIIWSTETIVIEVCTILFTLFVWNALCNVLFTLYYYSAVSLLQPAYCLLIIRYGSLWMYWCVIKVVYALYEKNVINTFHLIRTSVFNTHHLCPIHWLVIIKHAVRNLVALTNQFRRHISLISSP